MVAELGDAIGETQIGQHRSDGFHAAVDPTGLDAGAYTRRGQRVDERLEALTMVVVERFDRCGELLVGRGLERAIEQAERLHPVLHLIHVARRYRRPGVVPVQTSGKDSTTAPGVPRRVTRSDGISIDTSFESRRNIAAPK